MSSASLMILSPAAVGDSGSSGNYDCNRNSLACTAEGMFSIKPNKNKACDCNFNMIRLYQWHLPCQKLGCLFEVSHGTSVRAGTAFR